MPMPPQDEGGMPQDEDDNNVDGEDNIVVCMPCNNDDNDDDMKMPAVSSSFVNVEQEFTGGNGTKYTATLLAENGVEFNKNNNKKKNRSVVVCVNTVVGDINLVLIVVAELPLEQTSGILKKSRKVGVVGGRRRTKVPQSLLVHYLQRRVD